MTIENRFGGGFIEVEEKNLRQFAENVYCKNCINKGEGLCWESMTLYGLCSYYEDEDPKFFHSKQAKIEGINSQMRNITIRRFRGVMRELEKYKIKESARNCLLN